MANIYITLGPKANGFYDQTTGIKVSRGEKVEITTRQRSSRRIQMALNAGHLVITQADSVVKTYTEEDIKKLDKKVKAQFEKGTDIKKIIKDINLDQAKLLAELHEIQVDPEDTVQILIEAVVEDFNGEKE